MLKSLYYPPLTFQSADPGRVLAGADVHPPPPHVQPDRGSRVGRLILNMPLTFCNPGLDLNQNIKFKNNYNLVIFFRLNPMTQSCTILKDEKVINNRKKSVCSRVQKQIKYNNDKNVLNCFIRFY